MLETESDRACGKGGRIIINYLSKEQVDEFIEDIMLICIIEYDKIQTENNSYLI